MCVKQQQIKSCLAHFGNVCVYRQLIAWVPIILHWLVCNFYPLQCNNKGLKGLVTNKQGCLLFISFKSVLVYSMEFCMEYPWSSQIGRHEPPTTALMRQTFSVTVYPTGLCIKPY